MVVNEAELQILQSILGLPTAEPARKSFRDAVLVCVDCEAFEWDQNKITEVGVAVLDTRKLQGVSLEDDGANLFSQMEYSHFRISEYAKLRNKKFLKGDPEGFAFGESVFVKRNLASRVLSQVFHDPSVLSGEVRSTLPDTARNVVLVGHSLQNDTKFLEKLKFSVDKVKNVVTRMDTQTLAGSGKKNQMSLDGLLQALNIVPQSPLHNAGNDAAYTLRALILMAVWEHETPGRLSGVIEEQLAEKAAARAAREAELAARKAARDAIAAETAAYAKSITDDAGEASSLAASHVTAPELLPGQTGKLLLSRKQRNQLARVYEGKADDAGTKRSGAGVNVKRTKPDQGPG